MSTIVVSDVDALCHMLVQGWTVVAPDGVNNVLTEIKSMHSVQLTVTTGRDNTSLNVYIANGKTYVSTLAAPDETVTLYGVWLPDNYDAENKDSMQKTLTLLSPNYYIPKLIRATNTEDETKSQDEVNVAQSKTLVEEQAKAKRETEEQAKREAEEKAKRETEEQAKRKAEEEAKREAEAKAKREAEAIKEEKRRNAEEAKRKKLEAQAKAKREAEAIKEEKRRNAEEAKRKKLEDKAKAKQELEAKKKEERSHKEEAKRKKLEDAAKAKREADAKARRDKDAKARREADAKARREAEEKAKFLEEKQVQKILQDLSQTLELSSAQASYYSKQLKKTTKYRNDNDDTRGTLNQLKIVSMFKFPAAFEQNINTSYPWFRKLLLDRIQNVPADNQLDLDKLIGDYYNDDIKDVKLDLHMASVKFVLSLVTLYANEKDFFTYGKVHTTEEIRSNLRYLTPKNTLLYRQCECLQYMFAAYTGIKEYTFSPNDKQLSKLNTINQNFAQAITSQLNLYEAILDKNDVIGILVYIMEQFEDETDTHTHNDELASAVIKTYKKVNSLEWLLDFVLRWYLTGWDERQRWLYAITAIPIQDEVKNKRLEDVLVDNATLMMELHQMTIRTEEYETKENALWEKIFPNPQ